MAANQVRATVGVKDNASSELDRIRDKFTKLQKQGAKPLLAGAAAGATVAGIGLVTSALSGLTGVMGDAVKGAIADEESQNRLRASLVANIPAWDGNTAAIEDNIKAAQRLGFDDESLRDSLTVLAGATHDVGKAQETMAAAMDLARFKGKDLRTASEALIKVEGGQYRSLAQLGIKLREGASSQEALAAVQKVTAGQAEAYANTLGGKLLARQIAFNEELENLGTKTLPAIVAGLEAVSTLLTNMQTTEAATEGQKAWQGWQDALLDAIDAITFFDRYESQADGRRRRAKVAIDDETEAQRELNRALRGYKAPNMDPLIDDTRTLAEKLRDAEQAAKSALDDILDAVYGPAELRGREAGLLQDIRANEKALRAAKRAGDTLEIARLEGELASLRRSLAETRVAEQDLGRKPISREMQNWIAARIAQVGVLHGAYISAAAAGAILGKRRASPGHAPGRAYASGGYVPPGTSGTVGEEGSEGITTLPGGGAVISPNRGGGPSRGGGGPSRGGDTFNLTFSGSIGQDQDNIIRQVERMRMIAHGRRVPAHG